MGLSVFFFFWFFLHIIVRSCFIMQCQALSLFKCSRHVTQPLRLSSLLREVRKRDSSLFAAKRREKLIYSTPITSHKQQMSPAKSAATSWLPIPCPDPAASFPALVLSKRCHEIGLDVRGLSPVLGSPVPPWRWESFAFQRQQWGCGAVTVAVAWRGG